MSIITNASLPQIDPYRRKVLEQTAQNVGIIQDVVRDARRDYEQRKHVPEVVGLGADKLGDKGQKHVAPRWMLEDERPPDESVRRLVPQAYVEDPMWLFRPPRARVGLRPMLTPLQWEAIFDGFYCLRCLHRNEVRDPDSCHRCKLTRRHREKVLQALERIGDVDWAPNAKAPAEAERSGSGLLLPT